MSWTDSILLGILQGLTEFLPVSSSGHLVIVEYFLGMKDAIENVTFDVFLHLATLLAVVWVYRADLKSIFTAPRVGEGEDSIPKWRLVGFLFISLLVTGVVLPFKDSLESQFETISGVRVFLLINAAALGVLPLLRRGKSGLGRMGWPGAVVIGLAQAVGALPGISRSGSTILAGLLLGLKPRDACRYSFLLSIPTILVAALVQVPDAMQSGIVINPLTAIVGFIAALAGGLAAIPLLIGIVEKGRLWGFAVYCALVGIALILIVR
jgi:undecaprenyl-diphosphatase